MKKLTPSEQPGGEGGPHTQHALAPSDPAQSPLPVNEPEGEIDEFSNERTVDTLIPLTVREELLLEVAKEARKVGGTLIRWSGHGVVLAGLITVIWGLERVTVLLLGQGKVFFN